MPPYQHTIFDTNAFCPITQSVEVVFHRSFFYFDSCFLIHDKVYFLPRKLLVILDFFTASQLERNGIFEYLATTYLCQLL